jgi:hypothetical protein
MGREAVSMKARRFSRIASDPIYGLLLTFGVTLVVEGMFQTIQPVMKAFDNYPQYFGEL